MQKQYFTEQGNLIIRPYRLTDLAAIYAVSRYTIRRWINEKAADYGTKSAKYYTVEQVKKIISVLGIPETINTAMAMQSLKNAS